MRENKSHSTQPEGWKTFESPLMLHFLWKIALIYSCGMDLNAQVPVKQLMALLATSSTVGKLKTQFIGPYPSLKQQWKISSVCKWWTLHCYISSPKVYVRWCIPKTPTDIFTKKMNILHQLQNHLVTIWQKKHWCIKKTKLWLHQTALLSPKIHSINQLMVSDWNQKLEGRLGWCRIGIR